LSTLFIIYLVIDLTLEKTSVDSKYATNLVLQFPSSPKGRCGHKKYAAASRRRR